LKGNWGVGSKSLHRVIVIEVSPFASDHDRACELFYKLKGGLTDYGESHSKKHNHGRWGKNFYKGRLPNWDDEHPIHIVGYSLGRC
jgi:hypothetical protein